MKTKTTETKQDIIKKLLKLNNQMDYQIELMHKASNRCEALSKEITEVTKRLAVLFIK